MASTCEDGYVSDMVVKKIVVTVYFGRCYTTAAVSLEPRLQTRPPCH